MANASNLSKVKIYFFVIYVSIGLVFATCIYKIYHYGRTVDDSKEFVNYQATGFGQPASTWASATSFAGTAAPQLTYYEILIACCVFAFALSYIGTPLYQYFSAIKPLVTAIQNVATGHRKVLSGVTHNLSAYKSLQNVADRESLATQALLAMLDNNFEVPIDVSPNDDLIKSVMAVQDKFRRVVQKEKSSALVHENLAEIDRLLKDDCEHSKLNEALIRQVSRCVGAGVGVLYKWDDSTDDQHFYEVASYGFHDNRNTKRRVNRGEGQLGEVSVHKRSVFLADLPKGYLVIQSGLGSSTATDVAIFPLLFKGELYGALEIALFKPMTETQIELLERASESIGAHFFNYQVNMGAKEKLEVLTKKQAEELVEIHRLQENTLAKLESKLKEVEDEKAKNESILEGCVDGVITFDEDGSVRFCNNAATEILGLNKQSIYETNIQKLLPVLIRKELDVWKPFYVFSSVEKEISVRTEATLALSGGESVDTLLTCTTVCHKSGILFTFFIQKISVDLF